MRPGRRVSLPFVLLFLAGAILAPSSHAQEEGAGGEAPTEPQASTEAQAPTEECSAQDSDPRICGSIEQLMDSLPPSLDIHDTIEYALAHSITPEEAIVRLELQDPAGKLDAALTKGEPETFAGLWLEHEPALQVVVAFTLPVDQGMQLLERYISDGPLTTYVVVRQAKHSLKRLDEDAEYVLATAPDVPFDMGTNVMDGRTEVYTASEDAYRAFTDPSYELPPTVDVVPVAHLSQPEASVYAGLRLDEGPCTSGFSVQEVNGTKKGILTAEHCPNPQYIQGTRFPWEGDASIGT